MAERLVSITKDGWAVIPWQLDEAPTNADIEYVAGALHQLLGQNPKGTIKKARVSFSQSAGDSALELGCWMQRILPKLPLLQEVVLEFVETPSDLSAMIMTDLSKMPTTRIRVTRGGVEMLE
jgi:hypothetical protein